MLFATHAAQALDAAQVIAGLRAALGSRHQIGVAQGILMQRHGLTIEQAFAVLQRFSHESNTKLNDVAAEIAREHHEG
ncbi:ANTAR domain-containing protein [Nocardioides sp. CGMCC 1.13656]|uniref:ANTAR domain-containing protein n=1 Tax=Nocardioides TaxID=1839 RepID=UPI0012FB2D00|nr:ANTAR domain-containing protein [Nocardioides sp. CGMCC 1.13656]MBA2953698.1 ANTAR domain-containing protein [Nocardioides sp. CGMCC 1.13656]